MSLTFPLAQFLSGGSIGTADPGEGGFWPDTTPATRINRARDRLFVGEAASATGNRNGTQGSILPTATEGANWAVRDAQMLSIAQQGLIAVCGISRSADLNDVPTESIGVAGFAIGNNAGKAVWGLYSDVQFETGSYGYGLELAVKNKEGVDRTSTPYFETTGAYGVWLPAGGDSSYGGAPTHPNNTALAIGAGASTWNKGIVFFQDGLTGSDGTTGTATALEMAKGHAHVWRAPGNVTGFTVRSDVSAASSDMALIAGNKTLSVLGVAGVNLAVFAHQDNAVNYWQVVNRATGNPPLMQVLGSDIDIDAAVQGKGAGGVRLRDGASATKVQINTTGIGFFGTTPAARPTGVAVTAAGIHAALVTLGLITA